MTDASRRGFLVMTGAGAAAVATSGVLIAAHSKDNDDHDSTDAATAAQSGGPMVAWIGDPAKPEITIMVGEREVVVQDADLVAKLVSATKS